MTNRPQSETAENNQDRPAGKNSGGNRPTAVVGIGSSAGGLEALNQFFQAMPAASGLAFILVSHLAPHHDSMLPSLIGDKTKMVVRQVSDNQLIAADHVYIIAPDKELSIIDGTLHLLPRKKANVNFRPIDVFFRSLAKDVGNKAIGIILSGTGTDGTLGVKAIKEAEGLVIIQDKDSAKFPGMPASAQATGLVDHILYPEKMPAQLLDYIRHNHTMTQKIPPSEEDSAIHALQKVVLIIRNVTGHDFSLYKKNSIYRRIERRMYVHRLQSIDDYVNFLNDSEREVRILFKELLIGVTSFFRDPEAFAMLREKYLLQLVQSKPDGYNFRIWVPGCSSGEEVYSVAILMQECLTAAGRNFTVQIFGTDLDEEAINIARAGVYPDMIAIDFAPERLEKFFNHVDNTFQIKKNIRQMVVFAEQNVAKDPPFTKLDMLCCRNLLIYFGAELQTKLLSVFQYSLKPGGILFLGSSENIGRSTEQFAILDKKWKIFERRTSHGAVERPMQQLDSPLFPRLPDERMDTESKTIKDAGTVNLLQAILHESKVPICVVVDDNANLVYAHGRTGRFLELADGRANNNILLMARPGLKVALTSAIRQMSNERCGEIRKNVRVRNEGGSQRINLIIRPLQIAIKGIRGLILIIFEEVVNDSKNKQDGKIDSDSRPKPSDQRRIEEELHYTRENLQTSIEELETSNEELKSTNEELQSANEELQSTNEELETSKEELQSLNEEASTVNAELQGRIDELVSANNDIKNLLDATDIATIFLDNELNIRRFTPSIAQFFHLSAADIGRSIEHFASSLVDVDIKERAKLVLRTLERHESVIEDKAGQKYRMRVRPFRTVNNAIEGIVITFDDISEYTRMVETQAESEKSWQELVHHSPIGVFVIEGGLLRYINPTCCTLLGTQSEGELLGTSIAHRLQRNCRSEFLAWLSSFEDGKTEEPTINATFMRMDGSTICCNILAAPIYYKGMKSLVLYVREVPETN